MSLDPDASSFSNLKFPMIGLETNNQLLPYVDILLDGRKTRPSIGPLQVLRIN